MVLGGGQDASAVTTTDHRAGKFEAKFYEKVTFVYIRFLQMVKICFSAVSHFIILFGCFVDTSRGNWRCERAFWAYKCFGF